MTSNRGQKNKCILPESRAKISLKGSKKVKKVACDLAEKPYNPWA